MMEVEELQVPDDFPLLEQMLADEEAADELFRATNYWSVYARRFVPELRQYGLKDFRCRKGSILSSFGATDLQAVPKLNQWFVRWLPKHVRKQMGKLIARSHLYKARRMRLLASYVKMVKSYGEQHKARPLKEFSGALVGNPEEFYQEGNNIYTVQHLNYYLQYAYCCQFIDFDSVSCIVELGPGSGKQVEVIKKLHPNITFLLFDISPQLYVCEQYLKAIFPESVISYRMTRGMVSLPNHSGAIYIFGAYKFPIIQSTLVDLFWNSASFQEMEPQIVRNYMNYVRRAARYVYLREVLDGKEIAKNDKETGVLNQVKLNEYVNCLSGFRMCDIIRSYAVDGILPRGYYDCFWEQNLADGGSVY